MRVFFDTHVVFAAFLVEGVCRRVFRHAVEGDLSAVVSRQVLEELTRNLKKLKTTNPENRPLVIELVTMVCDVIDTPKRPPRPCRDRDDDAIIAAATACKAEVLVSGDNDLLTLTRRKAGISVVSPRDLLLRLEIVRRE